MSNNKVVFSVDLEDGVSIGMKKYFDIDSPLTDRILTSGTKILETLDKFKVKGTFFVVGNIAKKFPQLIKSICGNGHEIAAHSYSHTSYHKLNAKQITNELQSTKNLLEDITGEKVVGHRAPWLSINKSNEWIIDILINLDFKYDSSFIAPMFGKHWYQGFKKEGFNLESHHGAMFEIPVSTIRFGGMEIPFAAGSYFRMLPSIIIKYCFNFTLKKYPVIWYIHPYELETEPHPAYFLDELRNKTIIEQAFIKSYRANRRNTLPKMISLLNELNFIRLKDLVVKTQ